MSPVATVPTDLPRVIEAMTGFARTLRHAGVAADPVRVHSMVQALGELDVLNRQDAYWAGRLTLCADAEDLRRYDAAFALYFGGWQAGAARPARPPGGLDAAPFERGASGPRETQQPEFAVNASSSEALRRKDVAALTPAERQDLHRLFALLAPRIGSRRTHRFRPARRGTADLPRSLRLMLRSDGELAEVARRDRAEKPRRLLLLIDVSGSMAPYADAYLRFAHAAVRAAPTTTEVFTVGTRLTRVTRELRARDPERALAAAGRAVPDWSGGTRLGDTLKAFVDRWGRRGMARGAVLVICSDGWERGDPAALGDQLGRLARLAHALVWVNPHKGKDGFAPVAAGMAVALPHLSALLAGHSFDALADLAQVIGDA